MYNKYYQKALKYNSEEIDPIFSSNEGNQIHANHSGAYADWLDENSNKPLLAHIIRHNFLNNTIKDTDDLSETIHSLIRRDPPTVSLEDGEMLIHSYQNNIPVFTKGFRRIIVYHPNTHNNTIVTYKKNFNTPKEVHSAAEQLRDEGLNELQ